MELSLLCKGLILNILLKYTRSYKSFIGGTGKILHIHSVSSIYTCELAKIRCKYIQVTGQIDGIQKLLKLIYAHNIFIVLYKLKNF